MNQIPVLGEVKNLEPYVKKDWWKTAFDDVYLTTDGDVVENDANTVQDVDMILSLIPKSKEAQFIDIGCGQGRHSIELFRRGFSYITGLDESAYLLNIAKSRAEKLGYAIDWQRESIQNFSMAKDHFDVAMILGQAFGYSGNRNEDTQILQKIYSGLRPGGRLILDLSNGEWLRRNYSAHRWEWIGKKTIVCRERELSPDKARLISREIVIDLEFGQTSDRFYSVQLYDSMEIHDALRGAGYSDIKTLSTFESHSDRNQDLGLMQSRFFTTAKKPE